MFRLSGLGPARAPDDTQNTPVEPAPAAPAVAPETAPPLKPFSKRGSHMPSKPSAPQNFRTEIPRRVLDIPGMQRNSSSTEGLAGEGKRLVVGRDIHLSGAISSCDCLVVEGQVEADLTEARTVIVSRGGVFKGTATVTNAEISGLFDGDLTVSDTATVKPGGVVRGTIHYVNVVMERGGVVEGTLAPMPRKAAPVKGLIGAPDVTETAGHDAPGNA
jgi:cytoskeletal protein CcmA (bactofilin family)